MDKKRSILNVVISILGKFIILIFTLVVRRLIIKYLGNEINGVNSLYTSVIGFLAVTELGIGSAITFSMYKPIVENDVKKVAALYLMFRRIYFLIGCIIGMLGVCIIPFLPIICKDYASLNVNFSTTFLLQLLSVIVTYFYSAKSSLINAYKNNYVTSTCHVVGVSIQSIIQIFVLVKFKSFELYLIANIIGNLSQWGITSYIINKYYRRVVNHEKSSIDLETKKEIIKNVKAMFMHKIGTVLVNTTDSIIISSFIGVDILGKYSNYTALITAMISVIVLFFTSLTSVVGHMFVSDKKSELESWFKIFYYINFFIGIVFFLGFYSIIDEIIVLFFGTGLELNRTIVFTLTANYFIQFMRQAALLFRDASGTFYYDRWKPIIEGMVNLVLSLLFACLLEGENKIVGILLATIVTNLFVCHLVEPHIIYKYAFQMAEKKFLLQNYILIGIFILVLKGFDRVRFITNNIWKSIIFNGLISVIISCLIIVTLLFFNKDIKNKIKLLMRRKE